METITIKEIIMKRIKMLYNMPYLDRTIVAILAFLTTYLTPIAPFIWVVAILVVADLIMGVLAAKKRGEQISSKRMRSTGVKAMVYFLLIILAEVIRIVFFEITMPDTAAQYIPRLPLTYLVAFYISYVEFKSINENAHTMTGRNIWELLRKKVDV